MTVQDSYNKLALILSQDISNTLKDLLETKHLYQNMRIPFREQLLKSIAAGMGGFQTEMARAVTDKLRSAPWHPNQPAHETVPLFHPELHVEQLAFQVPHLKLFCTACDRVEPFNYLSAYDAFEPQTVTTGAPPTQKTITVQVFTFTFLCQSCKSIPEVFLVRREGDKLILNGRSPIEHVPVPSDITKSIKPFFSGAVVAHQSGQTLAGLFLLRVLIEQWVRERATAPTLRVDQAIDEYMNNLPNDFNARFPSLRTLYEKLSGDIHSATGSAQLFEDACRQIIQHFEARRLFGLS
jgi:hypothetical protein